MIISVLIAIIVAALVLVILMSVKGSPKGKNKGDVSAQIQRKGKSAIIKQAEKKLAHDPHNVESLELLGKLYYDEKNWDKVYGIYKTLFDMSSSQVGIDRAKMAMIYGISAFQLDKTDEALNALMVSMKQNSDVFETNLFLGKTLFKKGILDKAMACFRKAKIIEPENIEVIEYMAMTFVKMQKYKIKNNT